MQVELKENSAANETIEATKTAMVLNVKDALYDEITISDAHFTVSGGTTEETVISDSEGKIILTDLRKDTTYTIRQTQAPSDYRKDTEEHSFTVDGSGLIQEAVRQEMTIENRMIRASFRVTGTLLGNQVSDVRMGLTDKDGHAIRQWTTSGQDNLITGLEPGNYNVVIGSNMDNLDEIYIADEIGVQEFHYTRWTVMDTCIVLGAILLLILVLLVFFALRRRRNRSGRGAKNT